MKQQKLNTRTQKCNVICSHNFVTIKINRSQTFFFKIKIQKGSKLQDFFQNSLSMWQPRILSKILKETFVFKRLKVDFETDTSYNYLMSFDFNPLWTSLVLYTKNKIPVYNIFKTVFGFFLFSIHWMPYMVISMFYNIHTPLLFLSEFFKTPNPFKLHLIQSIIILSIIL